MILTTAQLTVKSIWAFDDIAVVADPVTTGLGLLDRPFIPHVGSPDHPETAACDALAAWYQSAGQPHWVLRDGDVLIVDGDVTELLRGAPFTP